MSVRYDNLHAVVTGAASGIGAATCEHLLAAGARVTALDVRPTEIDGARFVEVDLGDPQSIDGAVAAIDAPVDALFNIAGVAQTQPPLSVLRVNLLGLRHLTESLLVGMAPGAAIANVASIAGNGWPGHVQPIGELLDTEGFVAGLEWCESRPELIGDGYFFSKECVIVYTFRLARRAIARGIRVNCVSPGPVQSPMMPAFEATIGIDTLEWTVDQAIGRMATPDEMVAPLLFLNHPDSTYVNGLNLIADGGFTAALTVGEVDMTSLSG